MIIILIIINALLIYFCIGILFGIYFLFKGASQIDPLLANSKKRVRILLFPGIVAVWPFLISKSRKIKSL